MKSRDSTGKDTGKYTGECSVPVSLNEMLKGVDILKACIIIIFYACFATTGCVQSREDRAMQSEDHNQFQKQRIAMVEQQIAARQVTDPKVLEAMRKVPRHKYVPESLRGHAYEDGPLPIGHGQTISQPYIVAYMTEQLDLKGHEKVLEIGTGSGYQAAILAEIADSVFTIEIVAPLAFEAKDVLQDQGVRNIQFKVGNGYEGWPEKAPFDAIIVTAAPEEIPYGLIGQLKVGGRMIAPVGDWAQTLLLITKSKTSHRVKKLLPVRFVPMIHPEGSDKQ